MKDIKISVIIPVYNVEKYLQECVDSVTGQSYKNLEVILVDDGSPDNCPQLCDTIAEKDDRIKVIHKENGGASDARNAGMKAITGDYFMFIDSDDYWIDSSFLESVVKEKLADKKDVVIFGYTKNKNLLETYKRNPDYENEFSKLDKGDFLEKLYAENRLHSTPCNKIVNVEIIRKHDMEFVKGRTSEDIDWIARLLLYAEKFDYFDKYIYFYRENPESVTNSLKRKNIVDLKENIEKIVLWSNNIKDENYYETYMNYCAYQYITFLNCVCKVDKKEIADEISSMKKFTYLLKYNVNKKVKLVYLFNKFFGYRGMLKILDLFLKVKG